LDKFAFPELDEQTLRAIAARHGLKVDRVAPMPQIGVINAIFALGDDYVLRVPRNDPATIKQAHIEAIAAPLALAAGVRTPRLIAFEDGNDLLPVPYMIQERVRGRTLGLLDWEPSDLPGIWRELGIDLARLHASPVDDRLRLRGTGPDPRQIVENRASDGWITNLEARWLLAWLERLAPAAIVPFTPRNTHLDVQTTNIMIAPDRMEYRALLDWGNAGRGDAAWDFFGFPMRAVPYALEGHRSVAPLDDDDTAEARILWRNLQISLEVLPHGAAPGMSWGERPLAWLLEVFRFFQESPGPRWRELRP
jgi:aminoglycoside phosphotransferase (APT) family kinase protein